MLRKHEPDHLLLAAARQDAATGLLDVRRLGVMLERIQGRIIHRALDRVSPLSVSVMLEIGRERVYGEGADEILAEAEAELLQEAWLEPRPARRFALPDAIEDALVAADSDSRRPRSTRRSPLRAKCSPSISAAGSGSKPTAR